MSMGLGPNDVVASEPREDGAAFDHTPDPTPGGGKPDASEADEGKLAGKFNSPEELEKAYRELEKKFTQSRQGAGAEGSESTDEGNATPEPEGEPGDGTIKSAREAVKAAEQAGIDMDALNAEWRDNGELSPETYADLAKRGFDESTVNGIIEGQKARAREAVRSMEDVAGSQENLNATLQWAAENVSEAEANAYDQALARGDLDTAATLMRGIMAKRADALGTEPGRKLNGERDGEGERVRPFNSRKAMAEAMQDKRYRTDSTYREEVLARAKVTP